MKVTPMQEVFCQAVANGSNYSDAYRDAYPRSSKWKSKTVNESASRLHSKVHARIEEIKDELNAKKLWTREKSVMALKDIAECIKDGQEDAVQHKDIISAVKELNAMHGFNDPKKYEITNPDDSLKPVIITIVAGND